LVFTESEATKVTNPPNVLVVMVGDMGFSDLVSYGREIETPVMGSFGHQWIAIYPVQ
jgi:arylsulfatase A-like enzyme